jgi:hypothetical protein
VCLYTYSPHSELFNLPLELLYELFKLFVVGQSFVTLRVLLPKEPLKIPSGSAEVKDFEEVVIGKIPCFFQYRRDILYNFLEVIDIELTKT